MIKINSDPIILKMRKSFEELDINNEIKDIDNSVDSTAKKINKLVVTGKSLKLSSFTYDVLKRKIENWNRILMRSWNGWLHLHGKFENIPPKKVENSFSWVKGLKRSLKIKKLKGG